ncbi:hypothetical protein GOBAR_AA18506 [Gossypium barbadense]|uniref:Uncharacterized protein n=1 Tax=Gossypium barbadense TaxID=3634 RepID=A0A2P5XFR3_GOSBA|nr:hypothetical protein GOBAR_AA18506 [Gossypium barbadense]
MAPSLYCSGVDKLIPVDVYLSGCPSKPEAVIDAITKLRKKISHEIYEDQIRSKLRKNFKREDFVVLVFRNYYNLVLLGLSQFATPF